MTLRSGDRCGRGPLGARESPGGLQRRRDLSVLRKGDARVAKTSGGKGSARSHSLSRTGKAWDGPETRAWGEVGGARRLECGPGDEVGHPRPVRPRRTTRRVLGQVPGRMRGSDPRDVVGSGRGAGGTRGALGTVRGLGLQCKVVGLGGASGGFQGLSGGSPGGGCIAGHGGSGGQEWPGVARRRRPGSSGCVGLPPGNEPQLSSHGDSWGAARGTRGRKRGATRRPPVAGPGGATGGEDALWETTEAFSWSRSRASCSCRLDVSSVSRRLHLTQ